jgi:hypothetical protein
MGLSQFPKLFSPPRGTKASDIPEEYLHFCFLFARPTTFSSFVTVPIFLLGGFFGGRFLGHPRIPASPIFLCLYLPLYLTFSVFAFSLHCLLQVVWSDLLPSFILAAPLKLCAIFCPCAISLFPKPAPSSLRIVVFS